MKTNNMSFIELLFYYLSVVFSFGGTFILKCIIKKAIVDAGGIK